MISEQEDPGNIKILYLRTHNFYLEMSKVKVKVISQKTKPQAGKKQNFIREKMKT